MSFSRVSVLKNTLVMHKRFALRSFSCASRQEIRFVQYKDDNGRGLGVQFGEQVISLSGIDKTIPVDMVSFLHCDHSIEEVEK